MYSKKASFSCNRHYKKHSHEYIISIYITYICLYLFVNFIYLGQSSVLGGSRCTLSKALGPSYFPSIRRIPSQSTDPCEFQMFGLAIFNLHLFFVFGICPFELKVVEGDSIVLATDETAKAKALFAEAEKCVNLWKSCHAEVSRIFASLCALLRRRMRSLRTVFNVLHIF